jgi:hypothetical protein
MKLSRRTILKDGLAAGALLLTHSHGLASVQSEGCFTLTPQSLMKNGGGNAAKYQTGHASSMQTGKNSLRFSKKGKSSRLRCEYNRFSVAQRTLENFDKAPRPK